VQNAKSLENFFKEKIKIKGKKKKKNQKKRVLFS